MTSGFVGTGESFLQNDQTQTMKLNDSLTPDRKQVVYHQAVSPFLIKEEEDLALEQIRKDQET